MQFCLKDDKLPLFLEKEKKLLVEKATRKPHCHGAPPPSEGSLSTLAPSPSTHDRLVCTLLRTDTTSARPDQLQTSPGHSCVLTPCLPQEWRAAEANGEVPGWVLTLRVALARGVGVEGTHKAPIRRGLNTAASAEPNG